MVRMQRQYVYILFYGPNIIVTILQCLLLVMLVELRVVFRSMFLYIGGNVIRLLKFVVVLRHSTLQH